MRLDVVGGISGVDGVGRMGWVGWDGEDGVVVGWLMYGVTQWYGFGSEMATAVSI